ncbi:ArnT family glycosyltransferase [Acidobacteriota bacterium]
MLRDSFFERGNSQANLNAIAFNISKTFEFAIEPGTPSIDYEPIYPIVLGIGYKLFGKNWFSITLIQSILYGLTSWIIFLLGINLKDELSGFIAALYHSIYPYLFFQCLSVFDTTLFIFMFVLLLFLVSNKSRWNLARHDILLGITMGIFLLVRGSAVALLPSIILYIVITSKKKEVFRSGLLILVALLLTISPWIIRNYKYTNSIIISTHGGFGFWQGNNELSRYYLENNISLDEVYRSDTKPEIYKVYPQKARPPMDSLKVANAYKAEALKFINEYPSEALKLAWVKFNKFWSWQYNPVADLYAFGDYFLRQNIYFISYIPLLLSLAAGLYILYKSSSNKFLLAISILLSYTIAHMVFIGYTRLRLPLDPILMLMFGITVSQIWSKLKQKYRCQQL